MKLRYPFIAAVIALSFSAGLRYEKNTVQEKCERSSVIWMNGHRYVCVPGLTPEGVAQAWDRLRAQEDQ